jgi:glutathione S-transferase
MGGLSITLSGQVRSGRFTLPEDANARARAIMWMFAAVSSLESLIIQREVVEYLESDKSWGAERMVMVEERIRSRLG